MISVPSDYGDRVILEAVEKNQLKIVKKLIEKGTDVNLQNKWGYTPLHVAASVAALAASRASCAIAPAASAASTAISPAASAAAAAS